MRVSALAAGSLCRLAGEALNEVARLRAASASPNRKVWTRSSGKNHARAALLEQHTSAVSRFLKQFELGSVLTWNEGKLQTVGDQVTVLWTSFLGQGAKYERLASLLQALSTQLTAASKYEHLPMIRESCSEGLDE